MLEQNTSTAQSCNPIGAHGILFKQLFTAEISCRSCSKHEHIIAINEIKILCAFKEIGSRSYHADQHGDMSVQREPSDLQWDHPACMRMNAITYTVLYFIYLHSSSPTNRKFYSAHPRWQKSTPFAIA